MKTIIQVALTGILIGMSSAYSEGLVDGEFEAVGTLAVPPTGTLTDSGADKAGVLYHQTDIDASGVSVLDLGWYSGGSGRHTQQGTTDKYCEFASWARWNAADRFWVGQIFTDANLSDAQTVLFDVVDANFAAADDSQRMIVEVYAWTTEAVNTRISLVDPVAVNVTLLGSEQVDISAGVGTYSTTNIDFTSTATIYGIRLTTYSTNGSAAVTGALGIDNVSISTNTVTPPEPTEPIDSSVDLVDGGFEAVGALGATPIGSGANITQANSLYNQTELNGASTLDQGWYSGNTANITQQGTADQYAQFGTDAGWNKDDRWWMGQMFTSTNAVGEQIMSFDVVVDDYTDANTQTLEVMVYTVPNPTPNNYKLKLDDDISSFTLLGSQTVDISAGTGSYTMGEIDFTADSDLYAIAIQVYSKDSSDVLQNVSGVLGLDNIAFVSPPTPPPETASTAILSITPVSDSVMELVVSSDYAPISYPKAATVLTTHTAWVGIGHSADGNEPFVVTNLNHSTASGDNFVIYVKADEMTQFFKIGAE